MSDTEAEVATRATQIYMALDLWCALNGSSAGFREALEKKTWADLWADLCEESRALAEMLR